METILLKSNSKKSMKLLLELSKELGVNAKKLSVIEKEDMAMAFSIEEGRKSGRSTKEKVLKALRK
ncbi:MAG: hypothetical protein JST87_09105 [Bacteroidetes bacterium]|nr:hypothetical protein [Bacteroidota bacterium]